MTAAAPPRATWGFVLFDDMSHGWCWKRCADAVAGKLSAVQAEEEADGAW